MGERFGQSRFWGPMKLKIRKLKIHRQDLFTTLPLAALIGGTVCLLILAIVV